MTRAVDSWDALNQQHLVAELNVLRAALEAHLAGAAPTELAPVAGPQLDTPPAAEQLARAFRLSPFERSLLVACAGTEMDASFAALCARAQGLTGRATPTFSLALAALPGAHWSALAPGAPLRHWQLIEAAPGDSVVYGPLRISERVLHYLLGVPAIDERLLDYVAPVPPPPGLPGSLERIAARAAFIWSQAQGRNESPVLVLCGREAAPKHEVASSAAARLGLVVHTMRTTAIPPQAQDAARLGRLWEREGVLSAAALLIECEDLDRAEAARAAAFADDLHGPVFLSVRDPLPLSRRTTVRLDVDKPTRGEQIDLWRAALGDIAVQLAGRLRPIVSQFHFSRSTIESVALATLAAGGGQRERVLWRAAVEQSRPRMGELAERIDVRASWDDLVLPESLKKTMREILLHVRHRPTVQEEWGFETKSARGTGLAVLFSGPSGTGKTMAAEVLAGDLDMDLYRIDLSAVVSKYIGETEKNLRRVFDAAEDGGVVLLFDEADALFGRRSEVRDSHDRYANIEISYLLQRMEAYRGLAILTTNMKGALDSAFTRRLRFVLDFPFPGAAEREAIWRRVFPDGAPLGALDWQKLARLNVSGASIRNMAMGAAFRAADAGRRVEMCHLREAAESEYMKLERPLTSREVEDWA